MDVLPLFFLEYFVLLVHQCRDRYLIHIQMYGSHRAVFSQLHLVCVLFSSSPLLSHCDPCTSFSSFPSVAGNKENLESIEIEHDNKEVKNLKTDYVPFESP